MKNRAKDIMYCGVSVDKIKTAKPIVNEKNLKRLHTWITGRYMIRKRKDVFKNNPPWTKNPILKAYRFTNVRREHDRESRWLIKNIAENDKLTYEDKLLNIILFRMYNKSETLKIVYSTNNGQPFSFDSINNINEDRIRKALQDYDPKYTFFTAAFLTAGLKVAMGNRPETHDDYMPMRPIKFIKFLAETGVTDMIKECESQEDVFKALKSYSGIGNFLGYQMFVDFTYIPDFPFSENEYTVSGPGCDRGLKNIFKDFDGLSMEEALFWLRDNIDLLFKERNFYWDTEKLFSDLPEHDRHMNVMSLENCMCEISKYIRAVEGTGRPRNKYKGGQ